MPAFTVADELSLFSFLEKEPASIPKDKPNTDNWKKGDFGPESAKSITEVMHNASFS